MSWNSPREPRLRWLVLALCIALVAFAQMGRAQEKTSKDMTGKDTGIKPLMTVIDMEIGESREVTLNNGRKVTVKLLSLDEQTFPVGRGGL